MLSARGAHKALVTLIWEPSMWFAKPVSGARGGVWQREWKGQGLEGREVAWKQHGHLEAEKD